MVKTYRGYLRKWIKPRCGPPYLDEIRAGTSKHGRGGTPPSPMP